MEVDLLCWGCNRVHATVSFEYFAREIYVSKIAARNKESSVVQFFVENSRKALVVRAPEGVLNDVFTSVAGQVKVAIPGLSKNFGKLN